MPRRDGPSHVNSVVETPQRRRRGSRASQVKQKKVYTARLEVRVHAPPEAYFDERDRHQE